MKLNRFVLTYTDRSPLPIVIETIPPYTLAVVTTHPNERNSIHFKDYDLWLVKTGYLAPSDAVVSTMDILDDMREFLENGVFLQKQAIYKQFAYDIDEYFRRRNEWWVANVLQPKGREYYK